MPNGCRAERTGAGRTVLFEEDGVMVRRVAEGLAAVAVIGLGLVGRPAMAQVGAGPVANPYTNPMTNPLLNPYWNPALTQSPMGRDAALLYLLNAQRAGGGIGSGVPSGLRAPAATPAPAAEMPRSLMVPGGGAARYFQRGQAGLGAPRARPQYFQRYSRYFDHNGR